MKKLPFKYHLIRGAIGKKFVIKHYRYGVVKTKFPDMSTIQASKKQRECRNLFTEAVAYARMINNDAEQKALWAKRIKKGKVYTAAIREYMRSARETVNQLPVLPTTVKRQPFVVAYKRLQPVVEGRLFSSIPERFLNGNNFVELCDTG